MLKKTVLLVDDEPLIVEVIKIALGEEPRYRLVTADDGVTGLQLARVSRPDLVLLDVRMPVVDGLETCRALKSDPDIGFPLVVMLTALAQRLDIERGFEAGADDYIVKPFSPKSLLRRIAELIDSSFSIGQTVRLRDGRMGKVQRRISASAVGSEVTYCVAVETGTVAKVPAHELQAAA